MNKKRNILNNLTKNDEKLFFVMFFIAFVFKYLIYGFQYFPILDDYIQYGGYPLYDTPSHVLFYIGTISSRPLASLLDVFFWGKLWHTPHLMLILSGAFHLLSCVIFYKVAKENNVALSPLFAVFYLFFPLGYEATYWVSASSRIVVGLFFCSLSLLFLTRYIKSGKRFFFLLFFIFSLCAFSLYEACAVFCTMAGIMILLTCKNKKRFFLPLITFALLLLALLVYMNLAQNIGKMGSRASESSFMLIFSQMGDFFSQLSEIMTKGIFSLTFNGFSNGLYILSSKGFVGILYIFSIFAICIITGLILAGSEIKHPTKKSLIFKISMGIILFVAPFAPNMISAPVWITYRTMFIPMIGIYLILDVLFCRFSRKSVQVVILTSLMFIFIISGINEYDTYRRVAKTDDALVQKICSQLPDDVKAGRREVAVLLDSVPNVSQVSLYKDHAESVFHADWSLTGAVRAKMQNVKIKKVIPVYPDSTFKLSDHFIIDFRNIK